MSGRPDQTFTLASGQTISQILLQANKMHQTTTVPKRLGFLKAFLLCGMLTRIVAAQAAVDASAATSWLLASPNKKCRINVALNDDDRLSYEALRDGKIVIQKSPPGLRCSDQDFERALSLDQAFAPGANEFLKGRGGLRVVIPNNGILRANPL